MSLSLSQVWDDDLATTAQTITDLCTADRSMFNIANNLEIIFILNIGDSNPVWTDVVQQLAENEKSQYDFVSNVCNTIGGMCDIYKQVILCVCVSYCNTIHIEYVCAYV